MYQPPIKSSSKPAKSRLGLKVAGLFLGTFLLVFIGLSVFDFVRTFGEHALIDAANTSQSPVVAIDPKLEAELAKVLVQTDAQTTADIKNPFADSTGISGQFNTPVGATSGSQPPPGTAERTANQPGGQLTPQQQRNQSQQQIVQGRTVQPAQPVNPQIETRARLQLREERARLGMDAGPEAAAFSIDDLLPVGVVSGGDGREEVMFYSEAACRVVSFPVGTQFYDGWFESRRDEGVVFGFFDRYKTMRMRAWGRSVNQSCTQSLLEQTSPDQALPTTGGGD